MCIKKLSTVLTGKLNWIEDILMHVLTKIMRCDEEDAYLYRTHCQSPDEQI